MILPPGLWFLRRNHRGTPEEQRKHLFDVYIEATFKRRKKTHYTEHQTKHWLSWLAGQMVGHNQTINYIEQMQPDWLPPEQQREYRIRARFFSGLVVGLIGALGGLVVGLVGALVVGLGSGLVVTLVIALVIALIAALIATLVAAMSDNFGQIKTTETLRWSWRNGLVGGLGGGMVDALAGGLLDTLVGGLGGGLGGAVGGAVVGGLSSTELAVKATPNQGVHQSARSWLGVGLVVGLVVGLGGTLLGELSGTLVGGLVGTLVIGLSSGLVVGLVVGLNYGGHAVLQHYTLRWLLYRNGFLPFRDISPFLDSCAERIFLRNVGGYIFIHGMLMEHFTSLEPDSSSKKST